MRFHSLFLAWRDKCRTELWFPVGRLDAERTGSPEQVGFRFRYTVGADIAQRQAGFPALPDLPELRQDYRSKKPFHMIGWAPRYLLADLVASIAKAPGDYKAFVVRVNPVPAPSKQRVLIELSGKWPDHEPMTGQEFEPLVP